MSSAPAQQAEEPGRTIMGGNGPLKDELDAPTKAAVDKGLNWLAKNIQANGTIDRNGGDSAAIMGLAGFAFLANGSMPSDGPYGKEAQAILDFMLKNCQESGLIASPNYSQPMYGHGFATLYLAEVYGMSPREDVGEKLHNAIRLIVNCQQPNVGGWRYQPLPQDSDISVTICQVMALRAARNAGIKVPNSTIDAAIKYVKNSQEADGGFRYVINSGGSAYPRSAAGVACLYYMRSGNDFAEEIKRGIGYLKARLPNETGRDPDGNFYYANYYATQAMFMYGGDAWEAYWPAVRRSLLAKQQADGHWSGEAGDVFGTSMALIMLQIPNRLLPVLQK
ncbi:MAG TPA: prenyltransferase/squalene oxidase repeat-containing protein [Phycisphaerae bacterium]|nr:prenyltransferase/squalene oxidase repeat-containing protein [Phycisphaerae bacterium]